MKKILHSFLILLFSLNSWAQEYKIEAHLTKNRILIGDTVHLSLHVEAPSGTKIELPFFTDTIQRGIEITELPKVDSITENGILKINQNFTVSAYDSAVYIINGLPVVIHKTGGNDTLYSNSLTLICDYQYLTSELEPLIDTTLKDKLIKAKGNIETPFTWKEFWAYVKIYGKKYWYIWTILLLLIAGFIYWYKFLRKKEETTQEVLVPQIPPHTEAFQKLDELADKKLWQSGQIKEFYSELTDILRHYIDRRFNIRALEEISSDIVRQINYRADIKEEAKNNISNLLGIADYVKFAKLKPEPAENEYNFKQAYEFVKQTMMPVPEEPEKSKEIKTEKV